MSKKLHFFNMIEILLALTVIAIGMTSILGLFPVGLNASRNAVAQNISANVADQMVTYFKVINELDATGAKYVANIGTIGTSAYQVTKYFDENVIKTQSDLFLADYKNGDVSTSSTTFPRVADGWAIFKTETVTSLKPQMFFVVQGSNCTEDGGNRNIDYSAMALVWKSPVQIKRWDGSVWSLWPENPSTGDSFYPALNPTLSASYEFSGKLNIELSWPLELPYAERKTRYYQVVIIKP